ncbi:hypothetical protein ABE354_08545 [Brevibacillus laterosporus]|uniref:hypothetical protein n=1 Tax=Brevibacillus laterosporus TaxID=1465 RepID=UPI003D22412B
MSEKKETIKASKQKKEIDSIEQLIYIGPNIPGGRLVQNTVFRDGIPEHLNDLKEKHPQLNDLFVPVTQFIEAQAQIQRPGTTEYQAYQALSRKE